MAEQKRWKRRPENSTWGDYGPDDQLGRMNELTAAKVKQGIAEVKEGKTFCLSMPLDYPGGNALNPRRHPRPAAPFCSCRQAQLALPHAMATSAMIDVINDDVVIMHLQYSTQWDTLAHVGALFDADATGKAEPTFYNGYRGGVDMVGPAMPSRRARFPARSWRRRARPRPTHWASRTWRSSACRAGA